MPTTIPMTHYRARQANEGRIAGSGYGVRDELRKVLASEDFRTVATFSGLGLLVGLLVMLAGMQM